MTINKKNIGSDFNEFMRAEGISCVDEPGRALWKARAEIERLRTEIAKLKERAEAFEAMNRGLRDLNACIPQLRKRADDAERERNEARAEIERLREAAVPAPLPPGITALVDAVHRIHAARCSACDGDGLEAKGGSAEFPLYTGRKCTSCKGKGTEQ